MKTQIYNAAKMLLAMTLALAGVGCHSTHEPTVTVTWSEGPSLPIGLGGHVAAVLPEGIVVAGGSNWENEKKIWRDEIWLLDGSGHWKQAGKLPFGMTLPAAAVRDDKLFFLGGWRENGVTSDTFSYGSGFVQRLPMDLPAGRAQASCVAVGNSLYVIGGVTNPTDFQTAMDSVISCSPGAGGGWSKETSLPAPLAFAAVATVNHRIYLFGGMGPREGGTVDLADALVFDPNDQHWLPLPPLPGARRGASAVTIDGRHILIVGGCRNVNGEPVTLNDALIFDTTTFTYHPCAPLPFAALCEQAVLNDGSIYVIGGEDKPRHRTAQVVIGHITTKE